MGRLDPRAQPSNRGAALIFALGILACLTMLTWTFAILTQVERRASANYRDGECAAYAAQSGLERAKFELRRSVTTPGFPLPWLIYEPASLSGTTIPELDLTTNPQDPSFKYGWKGGVPAILQQSPSALPYPSGFVGSTYYRDPNDLMLGDYYALRVTDTNSQVYLNDENPHLAMMIDNLAWAVGVGGWSGLGQKILAKRPKGGFRRVEEIQVVVSATDFPRLKPYLSVHAYVDRKVIECGPQYSGAPSLNLQPRAPINVNLAPAPVLVAALAGIAYPGGSVSQTKAQLLAQEIVAYRKNPTQNFGASGPDLGSPPSRRYGFASWAEFGAFLRASAQVGGDAALCAAILANANPNTDLNKFVPDACMYNILDKTDLTGATTELCFGSGGFFTIESLGIVLGPDGSPVAASKMRSTVRVFSQYVDTNQADFETDRLDPNGAASYPGLRDITTGPEFRNASNANIPPQSPPDVDNLYAARYDGFLTFNAIAYTEVSPQGAFAGFIDRTLDAKTVGGAVVKNTSGNATRLNPFPATPGPGTLVPSLSAPIDWQSGSDLMPMGDFTGRGGTAARNLVFPQDDNTVPTASPPHDHPKVVMSTAPITYLITTYSQTVTPIYKVVTGSNGSVSTTFDHNQVTPNPPVTTTGTLPPVGPDIIPGWTMDSVDRQGFELWFKPAISGSSRQELLNWQSGGQELALTLPATGQSFYWGNQATLAIWIESDPGAGPANATFTVHCKFTIAGTSYSREWLYPTPVHAGTWHHVLFSFYVPAQGSEAAPPNHSYFAVDGNEQASMSPEQSWPTFTDPQALAMSAAANDLIAKAQAAVNAAGITGPLVMPNDVNLGDPKYQLPVRFPRGKDIYVGGQSNPFLGIIDNFVAQGNWAKKVQGPYGSDNFIPRFDQYRPSIGGAPPSQSQLTFQKRAQMLEWDKPIRVVACDFTAWKTNPADDGGSVLLGKVSACFGWWSGTAGFPKLGASYTGAEPAGWSPELNNGAPFNAVASGYLVPDRGQTGGQPAGFLTRPGSEQELYALLIYPTDDPQPGPRMAPVVDDVRIIYMDWDVATVLEEVELVD